MSERESVTSEQLSVNSGQSPPEVEIADGQEVKQMADQELCALKDKHAAEIAALTEQVELLRDTVKENLSSTGDQEADSGRSGSFAKTAGVKEARTGGGRILLQKVAAQAGQTGSRTDVQEYLRVRRNYV